MKWCFDDFSFGDFETWIQDLDHHSRSGVDAIVEFGVASDGVGGLAYLLTGKRMVWLWWS